MRAQCSRERAMLMRLAAAEGDAAPELLRSFGWMPLRLRHNVEVTGDRQERAKRADVVGRPCRLPC